MNSIRELTRETVIRSSHDVVVCGAGPAGVCAAISAARKGARTLLIERGGCLGGIWTSGLLSWILDCSNKKGIINEICASLEHRKVGYYARAGNFISEPEQVKLLLEEMCQNSSVEILMYTNVCGAVVDQGKKITHVIIESKAGRQAVEGNNFIDATGDGDVAFYAGCGFDFGKPESGEAQPMSLIALVDGLNSDAARSFNNTLPYSNGENAKKLLLQEMNQVGLDPSYSDPSLFHVNNGLWIMMSTHAYGYNPFDPESLTRATIECRREIQTQIESLRHKGGIWKDLRMIISAPQIGVREGRRIHGQYQLSIEDAVKGARFSDAVCRVEFPLDIHPLSKTRTNSDEHGTLHAKAYDIPARALVAKDVTGLFIAGRCISGDFYTHSSYRVTGDAATLGEAAGGMAAQKNQ